MLLWSHYTVKDSTAIESVQRRFTKRLPGLNNLSYTERLQRIRLPSGPSLELRRLYSDLIYCCKIIFGMIDLTTSDFFSSGPLAQVPEDIPVNYIRTAVLHVSDPYFSVSALLMYGMVYQQTLILAHLKVLPAQ